MAVAQAFNEGSLSDETDNASLNLPEAADITSKYVTSVTVEGTSATVGTVTVVMQGTNNDAIDEKSIVYTITCVEGAQCTTTLPETPTADQVPAKYLPKL